LRFKYISLFFILFFFLFFRLFRLSSALLFFNDIAEIKCGCCWIGKNEAFRHCLVRRPVFLPSIKVPFTFIIVSVVCLSGHHPLKYDLDQFRSSFAGFWWFILAYRHRPERLKAVADINFFA
jgi:hypothetical protein